MLGCMQPEQKTLSLKLVSFAENWRDSSKSLNGMFIFFNLTEINVMENV